MSSKNYQDGLLAVPSRKVSSASRMDKRILLIGVLLCAFAMSVAFFSYIVEEWSIVDSLYFAVVTMTTVGYGDKFATTTAGEYVTICVGLFGICIVFSLLQTVVQEKFLSSTKGTNKKSRYVLIFLVVCTSYIAKLEDWDLYTTVYFVFVTGVTLGYGDITPQKDETKVICIMYIPTLVLFFASMILGKINDEYMSMIQQENASNNKAIERILNDCRLTEEGFKKLNIDGDAVSLDEFLVGMLNHFWDHFGKEPDDILVEKLMKKFRELDVTKTGKINTEDLRREKEISYDDFIGLVFRAYRKVPNPTMIGQLKELFEKISGEENGITKLRVLSFVPNNELEVVAYDALKSDFHIG